MKIPLGQFETHPLCAKKLACHICRSSTPEGIAWREEAMPTQLEMPRTPIILVNGVEMFDCPHGVEPDAKAIIERNQKAIEDFRNYQREEGRKLPGNVLSYMIKVACELEHEASCGCAHKEWQMNQWGWLKCTTTKLPTIIGWLNDERKKRGLPVDAAMCRKAVRAAVRYVRGRGGGSDDR